jgi:hypothetical protein
MAVHLDTAAQQDERQGAAAQHVSLRRLYALRAGYLLVGVGLAVTKWPLFFQRDTPWPLMDGVVTCMLTGLSLLALLGVRYPLAMLPVLLFESAWKLIWFAAVAVPLWRSNQLDAATQEVLSACSLVVIVLAVIPWRYVVAEYATKRGERWR